MKWHPRSLKLENNCRWKNALEAVTFRHPANDKPFLVAIVDDVLIWVLTLNHSLVIAHVQMRLHHITSVQPDEVLSNRTQFKSSAFSDQH